MTDIVERLRAYAINCGGPPEEYLTWQAAAEIERLRAENKQFREQALALLEGAQVDEAEIERLCGIEQFASETSRHERDGLRAEIERLRAALHNIGIGGNGERNWTLDEVRAVAWDALRGME